MRISDWSSDVCSSDLTKKTKDTFNTAYFAEKFIRPGEKLKPMILNATNSKTMAKLTGSPYIEDWGDTRITVYVERSEEHTSELQSLMRISYTVFCLKKKKKNTIHKKLKNNSYKQRK